MSGMGGELGSLVASIVEQQPWAEQVVGIDLDPPRRRLRRAEFHLVHPMDTERIQRVVHAVKPHIVLHLGVYEPNARASASEASEWTPAAARAVLLAAAEHRSLESVVVRSGIEIYGRRGHDDVPDEDAAATPTTPFGHHLHDVETLARSISSTRVSVAALRLAPVLGPHVPSPLGRLLRLPSVPFNVFGNPSFSVVDDRDAARAIVAAAAARYSGTLNIVASGSTTVCHAARRGSKLPIPLIGPQWIMARPVSRLFGAPIPQHVQELLHHGRLADGSRFRTELGVTPAWSTHDVIEALHSWESVTYVRSGFRAA
jgi:UDP-glucose 4-epimerase